MKRNNLNNIYFLTNFAALALFFFAENTVKILLPLFITEHLNFDRHFSGYFLAIFSFGEIVAKFFTGAMADKFGRLKIYTLSLLLIAVLAYIYGAASIIYALLLVRLAHGFCGGMVNTIYKPVTASLSDKKHMGRAMGVIGVTSVTGMMLGAPLVVNMSDRFSYSSIFTLIAFLYLCASLLTSLIRADESGTAPMKRGLGTFIEKKALLPFAALRFIHAMNYGIFIAYGIIFARAVSPVNSGLYLTAFACGNMIMRPLTGLIADKMQKWYPTAVSAYLLLICGYGAFSMQYLIAGAFIIGIGTGIEFTAVNSLVFRNTAEPAFNRISATMEIVRSIAAGVGAGIIGLIYSAPLDKLFLLVAAMYAVQIFIISVFTRNRMNTRMWA